jgi:FixJ family two-component response regulator
VDNTIAPARRSSPVVIVVEDDEGLRLALLRMLRASGFRARAHACGEALLEDARSGEADCLVVDVHLPGMSGLDLVERLRQRGLKTPAVAISAHDEAGVREAARRKGIDRFLGKPFLGSVLVGTVNELLAERGPVVQPREARAVDRPA